MINAKNVDNWKQNMFYLKYFFIKCIVGELKPKIKNVDILASAGGGGEGVRQGDFRGFLSGDFGDGLEHFCAKHFLLCNFSGQLHWTNFK